MKAVFHQLGRMLGLLAAALLAPASVAAALDEEVFIADYLIPGVLIGFVAGAMVLALQGHERQLKRAEIFALAVIGWLLAPAFAAVPFVSAGGMSPVDAYFEAMSGLTTTGATAARSVDGLARSLVFWRALLQWLGGLATLVTIVLVLAPTGAGGLPNRHLGLFEHGGSSSQERISNTIRTLLPTYSGATLVCILLLLLAGVPSLDAFCLAFSAVSTGGFMPRDGDLQSYGSAAAEVILVVAMLYGATGIVWHRMLVSGREDLLRRHRESYWVVGVALGLSFVYAVTYFELSGGPPNLSIAGALKEGLVTGVSLVTTTGFESRLGGLTVLPFPLVALFLAIGAGSFSTAGGLKFYRVGGMLVQSYRELGRLIYPHSVRSGHFGSQPYDIQLMKAIWSSFAVFSATVLVVALVVALEHVDFEGALMAALSAVGNNGPVYAPTWEEGVDWPTYAELGAASKLALAFGMLAGRIEILILLALGLSALSRR